MPLSDEQSIALTGAKARIIDPPPDQPELLNKTGIVVMITDRTNCLLQMEDGSVVTVDADRLQPIR